MCLMGYPNLSKFEQSLECTFLKVTHMNIKLASLAYRVTSWVARPIWPFEAGVQNLFKFAGVRAAHQPHVY